MKKLRTILCLILALAMCLMLCACDDSNHDKDDDEGDDSSVSSSEKDNETPSKASGYKEALVNALNASLGDFDAMMACLPESYIEDYCCKQNGLTREEFEDEIREFCEDTKSENEDDYGKNCKGGYEIHDKEKLDGVAITAIEDALKDQYDMDFVISQGYLLDATLTIEGSKDSDSVEPSLASIEIDSDWYIIIYMEYDGEVYASFLF